MSFRNSVQNEENLQHDHENVAPSVYGLPAADDVNMEVGEEDEEDEDVDFNPFLRGDSLSEASSSLSSENEGPCGGNAKRDLRSSPHQKDASALSGQPEDIRGCEDEESVMQATGHGGDDVLGSPMEKEITSSTPQGDGLARGKEEGGVNGSNGLDIDVDDAICKRTRARHSLANYTLEELETFLQESDDDEDPPNVDDEEEYRKFLTAVLMEGDDHGKEGQGGENVDEDEDNDADFELEIEEALESDVDENVDHKRGNGSEHEKGAHMPVTRQKRRLKESAKNKKTLLGQAKMPLRPLMPYEFPAHALQFKPIKAFSQCSSYAYFGDVNIGFTAHQIGQLYCLIHEHVQLLIQVLSVSVLDPSKQKVASDVQKMILEMFSRREAALGQRKVPYHDFCFRPPNLHCSLQSDIHQAVNSPYWAPLMDNPVVSILDVAPLRLVKSFISDLSTCVLRYRQSHVEDDSNKSHLTKEPLFPLPALDSSSNTDKNTSGGTTTIYSNAHSRLQVLPGQAHTKKSLASMLVESNKSHVALVPKDIARSAHRFYPLFNAALFPRKPPLPAIVNRVLFTDAEDGLLAMGLMQYNNDWAAIQQHFLPCKSTHQIFVRQKNRSSAKAPENPIKAVRRMKTSPLTTDEMTHISEGLKLFKHDWLSVWKYVVPHRDPSLLPRLWRIATGTQKSYKKSEAMKAKRRVYDVKRRKMKASMDDCQTSSDKEVENGGYNSAGDVDGEDEAYVHEAFMADSEPGSSKHMSGDGPLLSISSSNMQAVNIMPYNETYIRETSTLIANGSGELHQESGHGFRNSSLQDLHPPSHDSQAAHSASSKQLSHTLMSRASNSHLVSQPCRTHKSKGTMVVKLAPDLPPVNLPASVRVISQSAFRNYGCELSASTNGDNAERDHVPRVPHSARAGSGILNLGEHLNKTSDTSQQQDGNTHTSQFGTDENTSESDLQMHPLLFQAPENQLPSYFSTSLRATGSTIQNSFFGNSRQGDSDLSRPQCSGRSVFSSNVTQQPEKAPSNLCTIDFHPLLQRADSGNGDSAARPLYQSGDLSASQHNFDKLFNQSECMLRIPIFGNKQMAVGTAVLTRNENENKLDLDIRLCSAPSKGKPLGREHQNVRETPEMVGKHLHGDASLHNFIARCPEVSATRALSLHVVPPSKCNGCPFTGDLQDDSIPGIVMEQEELSDSEEEIGHLEFECEEIDDSEEDELGSEQPAGIQNKEFPFFSSKEEELQANQPHQSRYLNEGPAGRCDLSEHDSAKENKSCASPPDLRQSPNGRSSKKPSSDSSNMYHVQTVQSKTAVTLQKPRKRPLRD